MRVDFKLNYTKGGIWTVKFCHFHPFPAPKNLNWMNKKIEQTETDSAWRRRGYPYWNIMTTRISQFWNKLRKLWLGKMTLGVKRSQFTFGSDRIFETLLKTAKFCSSSETCFSRLFGWKFCYKSVVELSWPVNYRGESSNFYGDADVGDDLWMLVTSFECWSKANVMRVLRITLT